MAGDVSPVAMFLIARMFSKVGLELATVVILQKAPTLHTFLSNPKST